VQTPLPTPSYPRTLELQKVKDLAGYQWLTPVILATQEAEIRRIMVQSQPGQIINEIPSPK
jgi:hypothetical protein